MGAEEQGKTKVLRGAQNNRIPVPELRIARARIAARMTGPRMTRAPEDSPEGFSPQDGTQLNLQI